MIKIDGIEEHAWITRPDNKQITVTTRSDVAVPFAFAEMIVINNSVSIIIIQVATPLVLSAV